MREIEWLSSFDTTGYGKWGRKCVMSLLDSRKYKVKPTVLGYRFMRDDPLHKFEDIKLKDPIKVYNTVPLSFKGMISFRGRKAGFCTCTEQLKPPLEQINNMNKAKFVIALSSFSEKNFKACLDEPEKVHRVNFPMFRGDYTPKGKKLKWKDLDKYKFKFLFVGRIDVRKNIPILIKAFKEEFGNSRNVCLILKIYSPDYNVPLWINEHNPSKNILWLKERISDISVLYRSVNAYVCADIGEAWGGPAQEAMLCGIPSIMPNHSGHLDYANKENAYLIDVEDEWREIGHRKNNLYERLLPPDGLVKYPIFDDIKRQMRRVYDLYRGFNREEVLERQVIKNALKTQHLVEEKTIFNQLDKAFDWIEEKYDS